MALVRLKAGNDTINVAGSFVIGILGGLGSRMGWSDSLNLRLQWAFVEGLRHFRLFRRKRFLSQRRGAEVLSAYMSLEVVFLDLLQQQSDLCVREDERVDNLRQMLMAMSPEEF